MGVKPPLRTLNTAAFFYQLPFGFTRSNHTLYSRALMSMEKFLRLHALLPQFYIQLVTQWMPTKDNLTKINKNK